MLLALVLRNIAACGFLVFQSFVLARYTGYWRIGTGPRSGAGRPDPGRTGLAVLPELAALSGIASVICHISLARRSRNLPTKWSWPTEGGTGPSGLLGTGRPDPGRTGLAVLPELAALSGIASVWLSWVFVRHMTQNARRFI